MIYSYIQSKYMFVLLYKILLHLIWVIFNHQKCVKIRERERERKKPQRFSSERSLSFCSFRTSKMAARTQRAGTLIRLLGNVRFQNERTSFKALFPYQKVSNIVNNSAFIHLNIYLFYYVCTFYRRKSRVEPTWLDNTACSTPELFAPFIHTLREILSLNTPDVCHLINIYLFMYAASYLDHIHSHLEYYIHNLVF